VGSKSLKKYIELMLGFVKEFKGSNNKKKKSDLVPRKQKIRFDCYDDIYRLKKFSGFITNKTLCHCLSFLR